MKLTILSDGRTPWELFKEKRFIGNTRVDICSSILKRDLLNNYIKEKYVTYDYSLPYPHTIIACEVHLGIDFTEHHRLTKVKKHVWPLVYRSTLVEEGRIIPKDYCKQFGIIPPRLYTLGFSHNNCGGFCVKAGLGHFKLLYEKMPERYRYHEQQEKETIALGGLPFLRKSSYGSIRYISLEDYRKEYLEKGLAEEDTYDIGGCSCALPL